MHDTKDATISNCHLFTGDDSLAANAIWVGGRNVLITNSIIYGPAEPEHGTSLRHRTEAGFQILSNGNGASSKCAARGPIDNLVLSGITMIDVGTPIYIAYSADAPYSGGNLGVGQIFVNNLNVLGQERRRSISLHHQPIPQNRSS
jgi:hypothetical protein